MTVIVVILINLVVYYSYKNFSLNAEMGQLENRGANIMEELQKANANNVSSEAVLQAFLLSDGYVKVIDNEGNPVVRIATESEYASLDEPYSTSQYKKPSHMKAWSLSWSLCPSYGMMDKCTTFRSMKMYTSSMTHSKC